MVLEDVGNVLAKDMADFLQYIKQDFLPHNHAYFHMCDCMVPAVFLSHLS